MIRFSHCVSSVVVAAGLMGCGGAVDVNAEADDTTVDDGTSTVGQPLVSDISVFTDTSLASPWKSWSWSTTVSVGNADAPLFPGSTDQIKAVLTADWGALSLARTTGELNIADYDSLSFAVRGTATKAIYVSVEKLSGGGGTKVAVPVTSTWTRQTIKLSSLAGAATTFGKLNFLGASAGQELFVDEIKLIAKTTSAPAALPAVALPANAVTPKYDDVVALASAASPYFVYVPSSYDGTHKTPTRALVWLHGCGGNGAGDAWTVSPGNRLQASIGLSQSWITVSVGGRDGACWNVNTDSALVLAALADVRTRFNVDPRQVFIGGYSSGGDLAYRTAFYNAKLFAGVIAENTSPFRDSGSSQSSSLAAAAWKFPVVHLAHLGDTTYPIARVRTETDALTAAGFPMIRIERAGTHSDPDTATSGTVFDRRTLLLPYLNAGWTTP